MSGSVSYGSSINDVKVYFEGNVIDESVITEGSDVYISIKSVERMGYDIRWISNGLEVVQREKLKNEMQTGNSLELFDSRGTYKGSLIDGKRSGSGTQAFANGDVYIGEFENDKIHGEGTYYFESGGSYEGHFSYGIRSGVGKRIYSDGREYYGEWVNGLWNGYGSMVDEDGSKIYGLWENNRMIKYISKTQFKERIN